MANRMGEGVGWWYIWRVYCFFGFVGAKKTKKSCGVEAGRRDDGWELEPGRGMAGEAVRMAAAGRLVVCRWSWWCAMV